LYLPVSLKELGVDMLCSTGSSLPTLELGSFRNTEKYLNKIK